MLRQGYDMNQDQKIILFQYRKIRVQSEDGFQPSTVGYERIQEIENPELAQERMKALYEQKGLIFTMLGEKVTTEISQQENPDSFNENRQVAQRGGKVAGNARKETKKEPGRSIVSDEYFLTDQLNLKQGKSLEGGGK